MAFGNVKPLMQENVLGQPPKSGMLKKKIFGKPSTAKPPSAANPFKGVPPEKPFGESKPKNLFGRLTGK
jgi:hypothetical protein